MELHHHPLTNACPSTKICAFQKFRHTLSKTLKNDSDHNGDVARLTYHNGDEASRVMGEYQNFRWVWHINSHELFGVVSVVSITRKVVGCHCRNFSGDALGNL
ncbi:hypothetical protein MKW98_004380 [Papaver atlanticum]|uniref:Uncharacterized protein n=1 Tax=Papaver atlanticum TaxID=357466 RepID=A0AAD4SPT0_9MAGN|nr:hypothetical protein MKW98_004380 [Papaver atlanticum]